MIGGGIAMLFKCCGNKGLTFLGKRLFVLRVGSFFQLTAQLFRCADFLIVMQLNLRFQPWIGRMIARRIIDWPFRFIQAR